jgi:hypothetical protein
MAFYQLRARKLNGEVVSALLIIHVHLYNVHVPHIYLQPVPPRSYEYILIFYIYKVK